MGRTIYLELVGTSRIASDLSAGGLFVQDKSLAMLEICELVLFNDSGQLELPAKAVYVDGNGGVGLELVGFGAEMKAKISDLVAAGDAAAAAGEAASAAGEVATVATVNVAIDGGADSAPAAEVEAPAATDGGEAEIDDDIEGTEEERTQFKSLHVRLRGLPMADQVKRAKAGDVTERTLLERMYSKKVWESLLRNPRLTAPEVARIARMGALPRPLLEIIVGNGGWLQIPEVRRALLSNPRLGTDQIIKLLRMMPKPELKLAAAQTAYSFAVRDAAKRMLKTEGS